MAAPPSTICPKCAGRMDFGLLADKTDGGVHVSGPERALEWIRGMPGKSWWNMSFKTGPGDRLPVATLRCGQCGFLELYAPASI